MPQKIQDDPNVKYTKILKDGVRISSKLKGDQVIDGNEEIKTMYEGFLHGMGIKGDGNCVGHYWANEYIWHSYNKVYRILCDWGSGLIKRGLKPGAFVGVYSKNCIEWMMCMYGCFRFSMVVVPLYDTLGPEVCLYCINHCELSTVVCDTNDKVTTLLKQSSQTPSLNTIIHIGSVSDENIANAKSKQIELVSFDQVLSVGAEHKRKPLLPRPQDLALVMYTSGTTGNPKGVMLSHENMVTVANSALCLLNESRFHSEDVVISFLPLAHTFEQDLELAILMSGASIGYTRGDITKLKDDFQMIKPTVTPMVPRLVNKLYDGAMAAVTKSFLKKKLLKMAISKKTKLLQNGVITKNTIWDYLIFSKIQKAFGNRLRFVVCGSAPLSADVLTFARCAFGCYVVEGYGQTENGGASVVTVPGDSSVGHVGSPLECAYVKLADVPEMDYYAKNDEGEVCLKGKHVMMGYYKDAKKTAETIDSDGWLHTGDVGKWLPSGALKIIDRKKHIFKLAQGEYIAPEKIENIYLRNQYVAQIFVHGESLQSCLVGIVVPEPETIQSWAKANKVDESFEQLCTNPRLKSEILQDLSKLGKSAGLHSFEQVKAIFLHSEPFSVENNLLTAILKNKRNEMRKVFQPQIQEMY